MLLGPGVKKVDIIGERPQRIFVAFSSARLATLGVSAREIFAALANQNTLTAAGSIDTSGPQVQVWLDGALDDLQESGMRPSPTVAGRQAVRRRGNERSDKTPATFLIRHQNDPALAIAVIIQDRYNGLQLDNELDDATGAIAATMPLGLSCTKVTDEVGNIAEACDEFMLKFVVALVFVIMLATGGDVDRITLGVLLSYWVVAVAFMPYIGIKLLPEIAMVPGGQAAIYGAPLSTAARVDHVDRSQQEGGRARRRRPVRRGGPWPRPRRAAVLPDRRAAVRLANLLGVGVELCRLVLECVGLRVGMVGDAFCELLVTAFVAGWRRHRRLGASIILVSHAMVVSARYLIGINVSAALVDDQTLHFVGRADPSDRHPWRCSLARPPICVEKAR